MDPSHYGCTDDSSTIYDEYQMALENIMAEDVQRTNQVEAGGPPEPTMHRYGRNDMLTVFQNMQWTMTPVQLKETCPEGVVRAGQQGSGHVEPQSVSERSGFGSGTSSAISHGQSSQNYSPATSQYPMSFGNHGFGNGSQFASQASPYMGVGVGRGKPVYNTSASSGFVSNYPSLGLGRGRRLAAMGIGEDTPVADTLSMVGMSLDFEKPKSHVTAAVKAHTEFENDSGTARNRQQSTSSLDSTPFMPIQQRWCYLDPTGLTQGPYTSKEMKDWYVAGFFPMQLQLRREEDESFMTLGEWTKTCGRLPFFDSVQENIQMSPMTYSPFKDQYVDVEQISRSSNSPAQVPMAATEASTHYMSIRSENSLSSQKLVDDYNGVPQRPVIPSSSGRNSSSDSDQRPEQRQFVNSGNESGRNSSSLDQEVAPVPQVTKGPEDGVNQPKKTAAEFLAKLKMLDQKKREEREREKERQRLEEERQRQLEEAAVKEAEERRLAAIQEKEEQIKRIREQIMADQQRRREEEARCAAEEEAMKQQRLLEEQQRRLEAKAKREQEERRRLARVMAEEERLRQQREEEVWNQAQAQAAPIKPAPWAANAQQQAPSQQRTRTQSQSLKEIQMEEERAVIAERRQELEFARQLKRQGGAEQAAAGGAWGQKKQTVWKVPRDEGLWSPERPAAKKDQKDDVKSPSDPFMKWCLKQVKALNSDIDAMAFLELLNDTESPSEAETYVYSYFGECGPARDFLDAYLQKRSGFIKPAPAPVAHAVGDAFKKPAKGPKMVLDTSALGFKFPSNPERFGEKDFS